MSKRANKLEMLKRQARIQECISKGYTKNELTELLAKEFKCNSRSIEIQYYQILKDMQTRLTEERELMRMELEQQLLEVQKNAQKVGANKVVIEAIMSRAKLLGLNEKVEAPIERPKSIIFKEKDMSAPLKVVPNEEKVENE